MVTVTKDVLHPGLWHLPDGRTFECKPEEIHHYRQRLADMLSAGVPIPLYPEHQDDDGLSAAEKRAHAAKFNMGHLAAPGDATGHLAAVIKVPNRKDAERLKSIKFCSPAIRWDWKDGTGRVWPGPSIVHLAATPKPVQFPQQPFKIVSLSHAPESVTPTLYLSLDGYKGVDMADDDDKARAVPEKKKKDDDSQESKSDNSAGDNQAEIDKAEAAEEPKDKDNEQAKQDVQAQLEEKDNSGFQQLLDGLKAHKIVLPEDTTEENLVERLTAALLTSAAVQDLEMPNQDQQPVDMEPEMDGAMAPMGLSQEAVNKINSRLERAEARALNLERERVSGRIQRLFRRGQVTKPIHDGLTAKAKAVQLSFADDGSLASNDLLIELAAYEKNPPIFRDMNLAAEEEDVPLPEFAKGEGTDSDEKVAKIIATENWGIKPRR